MADGDRWVNTMQTTQSFWTLIDELGPSLPFGGDIAWTVSLDTIMQWLNAHDVELTEATVEVALGAAAWEPGWQWSVESAVGAYRSRSVLVARL